MTKQTQEPEFSCALLNGKETVTETLESLIDKHGLLHVITGLELVCSEKAEHILHNWQDTKTAKVWNKASDSLYTCAKKVEELNI